MEDQTIDKTVEKIKIVLAILGIFTGCFWKILPEHSYYYLIGIILFLFSLIIFLLKIDSFWGFLLLCFSINNILDEAVFNPTEIGINEIIFICVIPFLWIIKRMKCWTEKNY